MTKNTKRRWAKSLVFLSLVFVFGFSSFASIISPNLGQSSASAALNSKEDQNSRTILYGLIKCLEEGKVSKNMEAARTLPFPGTLENAEDYDIEVAVGYEVDRDNGNANCRNIQLSHLSVIGQSSEWLFNILYPVKSKNVTDVRCLGFVNSSEFDCGAPPGSGVWDDFGERNAKSAANQIRSKLKAIGGLPGISQDEKDRRLAVAFFECNVVAPAGTPNSEFVEYNGKKYSRISNGPDKLSVGYDLQPDDGKYECNTLLRWGNKAEMERALKNHGAAAQAASTNADGEELEGDPCNVSANPLTWIVCPVVDGLNELVKGLDSQITSLLSVGSPDNSNEPNQIFCSATTAAEDVTSCRAYKAAWASVRNIALGFIVIVVLLVVISQALNMEILDAYTIRKALPRVLVAAIAVTLSWELMQFAVALSNDLGYGIRFLIYEPFVTAGIEPFTLSGSGSFGLSLIGAGAVAILGIFGVLSYAATAAIAVLAAFLVLILREMLIIMLVIFAPIAIVAYVLPNTQKGYRFWYDNFLRALLMFPMIAGMIAIGRVFAAVATDNAGFVGDLIGFAAYFGPYFMIPFTYKFAGGLMSGVGNAVNQRSAGMQQGVSQFRSKQAQKRRANAAARIQGGNALKRAPPGSLRARVNRGLQGATMLNQAGIHPGRMRTNMRTALGGASNDAAEKFEKENASFNEWNGDDAKLWAAKKHGREAISSELERRDAGRFAGAGNAARRDEAVSQIMRSQQETSNETFQKARLSAQQKTGTGYQNADGEFDAALALQDINDTYGSDRNGAGKAIASTRSNLQQSGQIAGAASFSAWAPTLDKLYNGQISHEDAHKTIMRKAASDATAAQKVYGKPSSARAFAATHLDKIRNIANNPNASKDDLDAAVAEVAGLHSAMTSASPANASAFAEGLMSQEMPGIEGESMTIREYAQSRGQEDPAFQDRINYIGNKYMTEADKEQMAAAQLAAAQLAAGTGGAVGGQPQDPQIT